MRLPLRKQVSQGQLFTFLNFASKAALARSLMSQAQPGRKSPCSSPSLLIRRLWGAPDQLPPSIRLPRQISRPEEHVFPLLVSPQLPLPVQAQQSLPAVTRYHSCLVRIHDSLVLRRQYLLEVRCKLFTSLYPITKCARFSSSLQRPRLSALVSRTRPRSAESLPWNNPSR